MSNDDFYGRSLELYHTLHQKPEFSNEEYETTRLIKGLLCDAGIEILELPLKTGAVAVVRGRQAGPVVALRCDIDALPVSEETGLAHASLNPGRMHACGHDFNMATIFGAACLLKQRESDLSGTVKIIFQPAEETAHGAEQVIGTGVLSDVQAIFGVHANPTLAPGELGTAVGPLHAAVDRFEIEIHGTGVHAAHPDEGLDPIVVAAHLVTALQTIVSRNINPLNSALISVTSLHGGATWNVIPPTAQMEGTVRTLKKEDRAFIRERMESLSTQLAAAFGATALFRWFPGPPATTNREEWVKLAFEIAGQCGLEVRTIPPSLGGEDFATYQETIDGAYIEIGTGVGFPLHHPQFSVDEKALEKSPMYFAALADAALKSIVKHG